MKRLVASIITLAATHGLFGSGYYFVDREHPIHLDANFRYVGSADFKSSRYKHSHVNYADSKDKLYFSFFPSCKHTITVGLGYQYLKFDWNKNPRFRGDNYHYGDFSLAWISEAVQDWRFVVSGGFTVDAKKFDIHDSGVGYAFGFGRYCVSEDFGLHVGAVGWAGIRNGYALPIAGIDWQMSRCFRLHAIFPHDISLRFYFHPNWFLSASYEPFGDYRYPRRAHDGIGGFKDAIFEVYSRGAELRLNFFKGFCLEAGLGGGYNFGGWLYVKNKHNHKAKYFHYKGAPYGHAYLNFNF